MASQADPRKRATTAPRQAPIAGRSVTTGGRRRTNPDRCRRNTSRALPRQIPPLAGLLLLGGLAWPARLWAVTPASPAGGGSGGRAPVPAPVPVAALLIDLSEQRLSAFDAEHRLLIRRPVSTGVAASPTPTGHFQVAARYAATSMTGRDYRIASVPHVLCLGAAAWRRGRSASIRRRGRRRPANPSGCVAATAASAPAAPPPDGSTTARQWARR